MTDADIPRPENAVTAAQMQNNTDKHDVDQKDTLSNRWDTLLGRKTELIVGVGATYAPRYPGADVGRLQAVPVLSIQRGILFADTTRGIGLQYQTDSGLYFSQSLYYDMGRLDRDSSWRPGSQHLAGMGDVPGSVTTRSLIVKQFTPWLSASVEAEFALHDSARRNRYRAGVEFGVLKTLQDGVAVNVDTWWGDRRYNQAYFGVTPDQAARNGFKAFSPGGGLYAWSLGATWEHHFDPHWSSSLQVTETRYTGNVADSSVIARRTTVGATVAITYTY